MPEADETPRMLNLEQFASWEDALSKVDPGSRYADLMIELAPPAGVDLSFLSLFFFSILSRVTGLHAAIYREIRESNSHAVFPLMRAFAEAVVLVIYVIDHPQYVSALIQRPREAATGTPKRKSLQALINYASKEAPGFKAVYSELSEFTHFGATAMWASHELGSDLTTWTWSSGPRWRGNQGFVACAQLIELADATERYLRILSAKTLDWRGSGSAT